MKVLAIILAIMLTSCLAYKRDGEWVVQSAFRDVPRETSARITVIVVPDAYEKCKQAGAAHACMIDGRVYVSGEPQNITMKLGAEYIDSLPVYDIGRTGDILAERLGLELGFNQRASLGHEFIYHIIGDGHY